MTQAADKQAVIGAARAALSALGNPAREKAAIPLFTKALALDPSLADVHLVFSNIARLRPELGIDIDAFNERIGEKEALRGNYRQLLATLRQRQQFDAALYGHEELCRLFPDSPEERAELALMLRSIGRTEDASAVAAELTLREPGNDRYRSIFAEACGGHWFGSFDPRIKGALHACFGRTYEFDLLKFYPVWISTVFGDPACSGFGLTADKADMGEADLFAWLEAASEAELDFLAEDFFLDGLRLLLIPNPHMEALLTGVRKWLCLNAARLGAAGRLGAFENFLMALGEQCFFNEYVYAETDEERQVIDQYVASGLDPAGTTCAQVALVSCYRSLGEAFAGQVEALVALAAGAPRFAALVKTQALDPLEERRIAQDLRAFGEVEDRVSREVRAQYEDNPYPRWISVSRYPSPGADFRLPEDLRNKEYRILIAGCGTGRQVLGAFANFPAARITAIDISRASLAYASRKVAEAGLASRVEFIHADILGMAHWEGQFDIIECTGVLHHMADPFRGWQILTDRLETGGAFRIALYSEAARARFVDGQKFARDHGFPSTIEGIRAFRQAVLALPQSNAMRTGLVSAGDFYTTSAARDLLFHVQEHRYNLVEIGDMMDRLGLQCTNFLLQDPEVAASYDRMFPQDPNRANLMNWHAFEQEFPDTFAGTYQFWCRKTG